MWEIKLDGQRMTRGKEESGFGGDGTAPNIPEARLPEINILHQMVFSNGSQTRTRIADYGGVEDNPMEIPRNEKAGFRL